MDKHRENVAIMFTDVVGYTTMMGEDEARTIEVVNYYQERHQAAEQSHRKRRQAQSKSSE